MAQTDYLNLEAFRPQTGWKPTGMLGGYMWAEQQRDYERLLKQAEEARRMSLERQRQENSEFMQFAPTRQMTNQNQYLEQMGRNPYVQQQAAETAQTGIAQQQSARRMIPTTEDKTKFELNKAKSVEELRKIKENADMGAGLLSTARELGPIEGLAYIQEYNRKLQKAGGALPEHFNNPQNWEKLYTGAIYTSERVGKMLEQRAKDEAAMERQKESSRATLGAAAISAKARRDTAGSNRAPRTDAEARLRLMEVIMDKDSTKEEIDYAKAQLPSIVAREWSTYEKNNMQLDMWKSQMNKPGPQGQVAKRSYEAERAKFLRERGLGDPQNNIDTPTQTDKVKMKNAQGQIGLVPKNQVEAAKAQGYTLAQ